MVHESLGPKTCQQTLRHALVQVQVYGVVGEHSGVLEHDRANGELPAATRRASGEACGARGGYPGWRSSSHSARALPVSGGRVQIAPPSSVRPSSSGAAPISSSEQDIASRNGSAENCTQRRERASNPRHRSICASRSSRRSRAASSSSAATALLLPCEVGHLYPLWRGVSRPGDVCRREGGVRYHRQSPWRGCRARA